MKKILRFEKASLRQAFCIANIASRYKNRPNSSINSLVSQTAVLLDFLPQMCYNGFMNIKIVLKYLIITFVITYICRWGCSSTRGIYPLSLWRHITYNNLHHRQLCSCHCCAILH